MEKDRGFRFLAIAALVVAVAGVSIGFAAFSRDLQINVNGDITPEDNFDIQFSAASDALTTGAIQATTETTNGLETSATIQDELTLDISATFQKPGDTAVYSLYVVNPSQYVAYLKSISFSKTKASCTVDEGELSDVTNGQAACDNMQLSIDVNGSTMSYTSAANIVAANSISAKSGAVFGSVPVKVTLTYGGSAYVDAAVTVDFGTITLGYSSAE